MNKKLALYCHNVESYLLSFIKTQGLGLIDRPYTIALSGGLDSMVILHILNNLYLKNKLRYPPRCHHINHGTRTKCDHEQRVLSRICLTLGLEYQCTRLDMSFTSNFENKARQLRYKALKDALPKDHLLVLGHHLDDSFEWHLMQSFKSSNLSSSYGIPLVNGVIRRPLLCLSKEQILRYAKKLDIKWLEDDSNENIIFERNYLRKYIIPSIKAKYPSVLKHYAHRAIKMARDADVLWCERQTLNKAIRAYNIHKRSWGYLIESSSFLDFQLVKDQGFLDLIHEVSDKNRGILHNQLNKLENLIKAKKLGRLDLSGGVSIIYLKRFILIKQRSSNISLYSTQIPGGVGILEKSNKKHSQKSLSQYFRLEGNDNHCRIARAAQKSKICYWI